MNYKVRDFNETINILDAVDEIEIYDQSEQIADLIQKLEINLSSQDVNSILLEISQLAKKCDFSDGNICTKFSSKDTYNFFFQYIFPDQIANEEIILQNIELIFLIMTFISKSKSFSISFGNDFVNLFLENYNKYNSDCKNLGIISVDSIISNNDSVSFTQEEIQFLFSLFPKDLQSNQFFDPLSSLYTTVIQKVPDLDIKVIQQFADILSDHLKQMFEKENARDYLDKSIVFMHNYSKFMLIFLQHNPSIKSYFKKYFKFFDLCYSYCNEDSDARNDIFSIYTILIEKLNINFYENIIIGIPTESIRYDIEKKPGRRVSIFNLFLVAANKEINSKGTFNILPFFSNYTNLLETILKIQANGEGLSFECLNYIYLLLEIIVKDVINEQLDNYEVIIQIMNIFYKFLYEEDPEFRVKVLISIDKLCENICNKYDLNKVKEIIQNCEDFDILFDLVDEHDEARVILTNLDLLSQDSENC